MGTYMDMRRRQQATAPIGGPWMEAARVPFRDDAVMMGPPSCTAADFNIPRLRRCPFDADTLVCEARLGGGLDGYVWRVWFGEEGPFALKLFWDHDPPTFPHYYAPQRECQNAALLQMMEASLEQAAATSRPISVKANPRTWDDAVANQAAFSDQARLRQQQSPPPSLSAEPGPDSGLAQITTMPRMRKCYGWLTIKSNAFAELGMGLRSPHVKVDRVTRSISSSKEYTAIVYEYVEEGESNPDTLRQALDFLWLAGFSRTLSPLSKNWVSGVLVDLCDIVDPRGYGWDDDLYRKGPGVALMLLQQDAELRSRVFTGLRPPRPPQQSGSQASNALPVGNTAHK